jgi:hypothetical protein
MLNTRTPRKQSIRKQKNSKSEHELGVEVIVGDMFLKY